MNAPARSEPTAAEALHVADPAGTESKKAQTNTSGTGPLRDQEQKTDQLGETAERRAIDAAVSATAQKRSTGPGGRSFSGWYTAA